MKTNRLHAPYRSSGSRGFGTLQALVTALVIGLLGFAGWQAFREKEAVGASYDVLRQTAAYDFGTLPVLDFYSCLDRTGEFEPVMPQTCVHGGKTYTRPAAFTDANIRGADRLPSGAIGTVRRIARENFDICSDVPDTLSVTRVLSVSGRYIHLGTGCDGGGSVVLVPLGQSWTEVNIGQGGLSCELADKHKIPRALMYNGSVPGSGDCFDTDGKLRPLQDATS